ncbi:hypothetical protein WME91_01840 [Sorangium sp. So ce269]
MRASRRARGAAVPGVVLELTAKAARAAESEVLPDLTEQFGLKDGGTLVISYRGASVIASYVVDAAGDVAETKPGTRYTLANGVDLRVGKDVKDVSFDPLDVPPRPWSQWSQVGSFPEWNQVGFEGYPDDSVIITEGSFKTAEGLELSFIDRNGKVEVYSASGDESVPLADGSYDLTGAGVTFSVENGVVVDGLANLLAYIDGY